MELLIEELKHRVLRDGEIHYDEAVRLAGIEDDSSLKCLLAAAREITFHFNSQEPALCSLINARSYLCAEDCGFCAQSVRFDTRVSRYPLLGIEKVVARAREFERLGIKDFCVVTSGGSLTDEEFEDVLKIFEQLRQETALHLDGSLGFLTSERVRRLRAAGVRRFNNNLQTSREFYPKIVSTHTYETRMNTLRVLQDGGMEICSGGILGMGESREDRIKLAFELKPYRPECLPVNLLNPRPGTRLEHQERLAPEEILKTIAVFRFIHPRASIKLAGGREANLSPQDQRRALAGGANGMILGGYLTTSGNEIEKDFQMLEQLGYDTSFRKACEPVRPLG